MTYNVFSGTLSPAQSTLGLRLVSYPGVSMETRASQESAELVQMNYEERTKVSPNPPTRQHNNHFLPRPGELGRKQSSQ